MTRNDMRDEFLILLGRYYPGQVPTGLVDDLDDAASQYTAGQIEETCRGAYPWPPPSRRKGRWEAQEMQRREGAGA